MVAFDKSFCLLLSACLIFDFVYIIRFVDEFRSRLRQDTKVVDKARETPYRGRSSTKADEIYPIPCLKMFKDKGIALLDILIHPCTKHIARDFSPSCTQSSIIEDYLLFGSLCDHIEEFVDIGVVAMSTLLTCTICKYQNVF